MNIILTSYLTNRPDPQRGAIWPADDVGVVYRWCDSVEFHGLQGIIFHDSLSEAFCRKWSERRGISFERVKWKTPWGPCEERVRIWRDWLTEHPELWNGNILLTDLADVEFYRDPFPLMDDLGLLYVGSETELIGQTCVAEWSRQCYGKVLFADRPILNCGIVGGAYHVLLAFLDGWLAEIQAAKMPIQPIDLVAFNRLIYREIPFFTGHPLHTVFRANQGPDCGAAIRHK